MKFDWWVCGGWGGMFFFSFSYTLRVPRRDQRGVRSRRRGLALVDLAALGVELVCTNGFGVAVLVSRAAQDRDERALLLDPRVRLLRRQRNAHAVRACCVRRGPVGPRAGLSGLVGDDGGRQQLGDAHVAHTLRETDDEAVHVEGIDECEILRFPFHKRELADAGGGVVRQGALPSGDIDAEASGAVVVLAVAGGEAQRVRARQRRARDCELPVLDAAVQVIREPVLASAEELAVFEGDVAVLWEGAKGRQG